MIESRVVPADLYTALALFYRVQGIPSSELPPPDECSSGEWEDPKGNRWIYADGVLEMVPITPVHQVTVTVKVGVE